MDKPTLGRALQRLIDAQPGLLARVIKGPKNRRLFQPLQRFFGLSNGNGGSANSSPIPASHAHAHPYPSGSIGSMCGSSNGSSAASSRSSSPARSGAEPVWADALKTAFQRWLELDRGFGAATVQVRCICLG
jgi:hypothetical protein